MSKRVKCLLSRSTDSSCGETDDKPKKQVGCAVRMLARDGRPGGYASRKRAWQGTSLVAQWIGLRAPNAGGPGSIPGQGTRSHMHDKTEGLHAATKEPACYN